jgi:protocatechuate 3,4-dioxygenase beta subunit
VSLNLLLQLAERVSEELLNLAAAQADHMRMLLLHACLVVMLIALHVHQVELVHHAALLQHLERSVHSHPIELRIALFRHDVQPLSVQMFAGFVNQIEQDLPLAGQPDALLFERVPYAFSGHAVMFSLAGDNGNGRHDSRLRRRRSSCQDGECGEGSEDSAGPAERAIHIPRLYHVYVMQRGRNQLRTRNRLPLRMLRVCLMFLLISAAFAQRSGQSAPAPASGKLGSVRGVVVGAADEPLRKADVTLRSLSRGGGFGGGGGPMRGGPPMGGPGGEGGGLWMANTDASGAFAFENVPPGQYSLSVQRNGYVRHEYGSRPGSRGGASITVSDGQKLTGVSVKMVPHGVIAGRVLDEDGDPVMHASVQVMRERWIGNRRQMAPLNADSTNDLGEYRLAGLMPGRYHLMVAYNRPEPPNRPRAEGAVADMTYASLYYPGVAELSQAATVQVTPGQELRGIDFQLRKTPTFRVRGRVLDESGKPASGAGVMAMPAEGGFVAMRGMGMMRNKEGSFEIAGLPPGSYVLIANRMGREQSRTTARTTVQVGNRDLDGVVLQMQSTFEIAGTVRAPEGTAIAGARVMAESLERSGPFQGMIGGAVEPGGTWKLAGVAAGKYRIYMTPAPQGTYLKSVMVQGQDITAGADISASANGIEIQLAAKAPEVTGSVIGAEKEPVTGATVVLVPESGRRDQYWLFRTASSGENGAFTLRGIVPGNYTAYAFREAEDGIWYSPEFMKTAEGKGVSLKLAEGAAETVQITAAQ